MPRGPKPQHVVRLNAKEYEQLKHMSRCRKAPHAEVVRAKILLGAYEHPDWDNATIARKVGCTDRTVRKWRKLSREGPMLKEAPRPGAPRFFSLQPKSPGHRSRVHAPERFRKTSLTLV